MYSLFKSFEREPLQPVQKSQLKDKTNPKVKIIMMLKLTFLLKKTAQCFEDCHRAIVRGHGIMLACFFDSL